MLTRAATGTRTREPRRGLVLAAAAAAWLLAWTGGALAQESCESALRQAENSYELGLFEDVPGQLQACLKGRRPSRAEQVRTQALLAKSYLAADQPEKARDAVAELLRVDPAYEPGPPPQFARMVEELRRRESELQVATVSKTGESLREAPATVVVVHAEEIEQRGYLDLEQVLHDLPGFDISRGNGETYSNFYQRGFRSKDNDRILLLVDGVEQNDLTTSIADLSRQYPVSSVDRIEVVYGPASTIYGANAYSGVINIITKPPEAFIQPGRRFGTLVQAAGGSFGTRYTDLAFAGQDRSGSVAWSVTGRLFRSDEMDLSNFPGWRYDFAAVPYKDLLRLTGGGARGFCGSFGKPFYCGEDLNGAQPLITVGYDAAGNAQVVDLTDAGERLARGSDEALGLRFSDPTEDWSLYAKLRLANLTLGLQAWGLEEGVAPWYNGANRAPARWAPEHKSLFVKYGRTLGKNLSLNLFTRYRQTDLDPQRSARSGEISDYANGALHLEDLVNGCGDSPHCASSIQTLAAPGRLATQAAAELTLVYAPRRQFTLVSGLDLRKGSIETREAPLNELVDHSDAGLYAQASYKPLPTLSLVAGGRVDYNEASSREFPHAGFGTIFTPRLAVVYLPRQYALKLIYSEAFKDPSDFEKFAPEKGDLANPDLLPERTRSLEISAGWQRDDATSLELAAYHTRFEDLVSMGHLCLFPAGVFDTPPTPFPCPPDHTGFIVLEQLQSIGEMEAEGVELRAATRIGKTSLFGNFTYIDPHGTEPHINPGHQGALPRRRIADIASHRANLGAAFPLWKKASLSLRWNYVGSRPTGEGTSIPTNPLRRIDAYSVAHATFTYKDVIPGASLQLIVNNLLDEGYEDPGINIADGIDFAASIPQPGRTVYLRLTWGLRSREPEGAGEISKP